MKVTLEIWRQDGPKATGHFQNYVVNDAEAEWSIHSASASLTT